MPSQLFTNDAVSFVCGRNFTYAGVDYKVGEDFPEEAALNIETLVRTRFVIPVVEDRSAKPRHWHREVRVRSEVMEKLGVAPIPEEKPAKKATAKKAPVKKAAAKGN